MGISQVIAPLAIRLLQLPSSAAACDRNWSQQGLVHTKLRNRLTPDKVKKLVAVKASLNRMVVKTPRSLKDCTRTVTVVNDRNVSTSDAEESPSDLEEESLSDVENSDIDEDDE